MELIVHLSCYHYCELKIRSSGSSVSQKWLYYKDQLTRSPSRCSTRSILTLSVAARNPRSASIPSISVRRFETWLSMVMARDVSTSSPVEIRLTRLRSSNSVALNWEKSSRCDAPSVCWRHTKNTRLGELLLTLNCTQWDKDSIRHSSNFPIVSSKAEPFWFFERYVI